MTEGTASAAADVPVLDRARALGGVGRARKTAPWQAITLVWLASRLVVFAGAASAQLLGLGFRENRPGFVQHPFHWLTTWDGHWYKLIGEHGYLLMPGRYSDPAFFPLLPILLRGLHGVGLPYDLAGLALTNAAFLVALIGLYKLACHWLPEPDARRTAIIAALFPGGVAMAMVYPESIALALMAFAGLFAYRRQWLLTALCAALATLARPEGLLLTIPIAVSAARAWPDLSPQTRGRATAAVIAAPATLATVSIYFWQTLGNPFAWSDAEQAWGRSMNPSGPYHALTSLLTASHYELWQIRDAVSFAIYLGLLAIAWKTMPKSWIIAGAGITLLPLTTGSFKSIERFGLMALPIYAAIAVMARSPRAQRIVLAATALMLFASTWTLPYRYP
jgi:hypothetical protein